MEKFLFHIMQEASCSQKVEENVLNTGLISRFT